MAEIGAEIGAESGYARAHDPAPEQANLSTLVNIGGAVLSLSLLVGVGVWGYKLLSRDVTGLPVVRAVEGPMRVQPTEPGGRPADNQGLAVNDIAARGSAAAPADRLVLAPQPVDLMEEDVAGGDRQEAAAPRAPSAAAPADAEPGAAANVADLVNRLTDGIAPIETGDAVQATPVVAVLTPQDGAEEGAAPAADVPQDDTLQADSAQADAAQATSPADAVVQELAAAGGVAQSLRPRARPVASAAAAPQGAQAASVQTEIDGDTLPAGTRLAQLGAYESAEIARQEWGRISARFTEYFEEKQMVIQKASSGGRTFYRLRAMGFGDLSDARRFCAVLVAGNSDCIPVTTR